MNAMKVRWKGETEFLMLTHDKVYTVLGMEKGWYRLVDDSGEDYLYPVGLFADKAVIKKTNGALATVPMSELTIID